MCTPTANSRLNIDAVWSEHRTPLRHFHRQMCDMAMRRFAAGDSFSSCESFSFVPFSCACVVFDDEKQTHLYYYSSFPFFVVHLLSEPYWSTHMRRYTIWEAFAEFGVLYVFKWQRVETNTHTRNFINKRNLILSFRSWAISSSLVSTVEERTRYELNNNKINVSSTKLIIWCK